MKKLTRMAAVHDMSGYGKCSLTVAIPVASAAGIEVCPLPTALLSTNTLFEGFTFFDFTPHMPAYMAHWSKLGLKFDCVYSGFLGSVEQIDMVKMLINDFDSGLAVVDPVMGDHGVVIKTYTKEMCAAMGSLVAAADIATPNITEACILTGREYCGAELDSAQSEQLCRDILALGTKAVVLTGVNRGDKLVNCGITKEGVYFEKEVALLPFNMHGTGDLFTSVMTSGILTGHSLEDSVDSAARFIYDVMEYSRDVEDANERGVAFEPFVYRLHTGIYNTEA